MTWLQNYTPIGGVAASALLAALPVVVLLALLAVWHVRAHLAAMAGLACALAVALFVYKMPAPFAFAAALNGAAYGLFPIGWIVLNAIFIYELSVTTGQFEALKQHVSSLADDRRIQALLIAFSFGAFIEGCAGFGAPVAITAALLIGLGFKPLEAAGLALIGNTAPVAFGSLGIPLIALNKATGLELQSLSAMVGRQLPPFSFLIPFWLITVQAGWRGMLEVWPACFVTGLSFALTQFVVSNYHGPMLVDLASSLVSMGALLLLLKVWRPRPSGMFSPAQQLPTSTFDVRRSTFPILYRMANETEEGEGETSNVERRTSNVEVGKTAGRQLLRAWLPWLCLTAFVFTWSLPRVKAALDAISGPTFAIPCLHRAVVRMPPVVAVPTPDDALFKLNWLSATGTALLLAGLTAGLLLGVRPYGLARLYLRTLLRVRISLLTIAAMLALGFTTRFCGSDTTMGLALAGTGALFPFFSPLLGWLGVALTGSDTSSNVLFGNLQQTTAQSLGLPPLLTCAANSSGGVMGKMIDAQSLVVASLATGGRPDSPDAGTILRFVFWHSLALAVLVGIWVMLQAYVFPWMVP